MTFLLASQRPDRDLDELVGAGFAGLDDDRLQVGTERAERPTDEPRGRVACQRRRSRDRQRRDVGRMPPGIGESAAHGTRRDDRVIHPERKCLPVSRRSADDHLLVGLGADLIRHHPRL